MSTIEVRNISKTYGKTTALNNISLTFKENCIYGLLGRNGAGKSTLLNIISGRVFADSGEVLIDGVNARSNDSALGKVHMMSEQLLYNPSLKVGDMFKTASSFYSDFDMEYALKLCDEYELDPKKRLSRLSTGYRTIAKAINALACGAPIVFFDEPILGLDANHRDLFYKHVISRYNERPATYVISTHLIEETAGIIERAVVIKKGDLLLDKDTDEIRSMGYSVSGKAELVDSFANGKELMGEDIISGFKTVYIKGRLEDADIPDELSAEPMNLQNVFIHLTNS
ncbi:MAG: ATP-binding cassette domain-containing protein [Oscillospiraceae bacterium]